MAKKTISKNVSFDNFDEFVAFANQLKEKKTEKTVNFGGNIVKDEKSGEAVLRINLNWDEDETF